MHKALNAYAGSSDLSVQFPLISVPSIQDRPISAKRGLPYMTSTQFWVFSALFVCKISTVFLRKLKVIYDPLPPLLCGCHIWKPSNEIVDDIDSRPEGESASLPPRFPLSTLASEEMPFCDVFDDRNYHNHTHERCQDLFKVMSSVKVLIGY